MYRYFLIYIFSLSHSYFMTGKQCKQNSLELFLEAQKTENMPVNHRYWLMSICTTKVHIQTQLYTGSRDSHLISTGAQCEEGPEWLLSVNENSKSKTWS